jgi:hypothetical protein
MRLIIMCVLLIVGMTLLYGQSNKFDFIVKINGNITMPIYQENSFSKKVSENMIRPGFGAGLNVGFLKLKHVQLYSGLDYYFTQYIHKFSLKFGSGGGVPSIVENKIQTHILAIPIGLNYSLGQKFNVQFSSSFAYSFTSPVKAIVTNPAGEDEILGKGEKNAERRYNIRLELIPFYRVYASGGSRKKGSSIDVGAGVAYHLLTDQLYFLNDKVNKLSPLLTIKWKL